ncbi:MAG: hypothetical protein Q8O37_06305 [Sulfuricellaceae bacterium]|nr:hypothetical protein [Sulfuricellaceae bacterium]
MRHFLHIIVVLGFILSGGPAWSAQAKLVLESGNEIPLDTYPAQGETILLWFMCDEGHGSGESRIAGELAQRGVETWIPDLLDAHFLPRLPSSLKEIPPQEISEVIAHTVAASKKNIVLVTAGHGAATILAGAKLWQARTAESARTRLKAVILFYPDLYELPPAPGVDGQYHPAVGQNRLPIFIYQPQQSPGLWWLGAHKTALSHDGVKVQSKVLPGVRNHFFVRPDPTPEESATTARLPELIQDAIKELVQ